MKKKKVALRVLVCLILFLVLRELDVVDASFYQLSSSSTKSESKSSHRPPGTEKEPETSYNLTIKHHDQNLHSYRFSYNSHPPIEIEATLEEPVYSGNSAWPLYKNFTMTYRCKYTTLTSPSEWSASGDIEGEVTTEILGFCSRRKARDLAFEKAKEQVIATFKKSPFF